MSETKNKRKKNWQNFEYSYDDYLKELGKAIIELRRDANLTQGELAGRVEKGQPSIAKLENGPTPNVALRNLYEVTEALTVPLSKLFELTEANLLGGAPRSSGKTWEDAVELINNLPPQKQAWLADVIFTVLKAPSH